jgi:hypothetical protein
MIIGKRYWTGAMLSLRCSRRESELNTRGILLAGGIAK